jgi:hypothetical protein
MNFVERDNGEWIAECLFSFRKWYSVFGNATLVASFLGSQANFIEGR